jgi:hypothetical protein
MSWAATLEVLTTADVQPVLDCGGELFSVASDNECKALNKVEHKALRLITGAAKFTPSASVEIQTKI